MSRGLKSVYFFGFIFLIIDQVIKTVLTNNLILNQNMVIIKDFFSINLAHNTGAAFSILSGSRILLILISVIAFIALSIYIKRCNQLDDIDIFIYSLLVGGILGNLVDRIIHGYVIDYISLKFGSYYFPIFNFADICIVLSIVFIIFRTLKEDLWK